METLHTVLQAAANIAWALQKAGKNASISLTLEESNSVGVTMLGGISVEKAIEMVKAGKAEGAVILENDLYRRVDSKLADEFFSVAKDVVVLDHTENRTSAKATVVMPVGTFAESDGTLVNNEGRAQRFYRVFMPDGDIVPGWKRIAEVMQAAGKKSTFNTLQDIIMATASAIAEFKGIEGITPPPDFRVNGLKIPRESHRYSGRTAMKAHINVSEQKPPEDPDSAMSFTMEGFQGNGPSSMIPFFWNPGWNSAQAINKYQIEVGGPLHGGDPGNRLIEPSETAPSYYNSVPVVWSGGKGALNFIPVYHIFGSEPFSAMSPAVAQRIPALYLALNPDDAQSMKLEDGTETELEVNNRTVKVKVIIKDELAEGLAGIPAGFVDFSPAVGIKIAGK